MEKKKKGGLITKTWERCKSIGRGGPARSKSWGGGEGWKKAPQGCFCVYVGPQMERFAIKTEYANHPLFKMLLEEAESEYGYCSQGPLALPCDVDLFCKLLIQMEMDSHALPHARHGCAWLTPSPSAYHLLRSSSMPAITPF